VSHYRLHGIDGMCPRRSTYSAQFKLQALSHQDREQLSSRIVAVGRAEPIALRTRKDGTGATSYS